MQIEMARAEDAQAIWNIRGNALRTQCVGYYDAALLAAWAGGDMPAGFAQDVENRFQVMRIEGRVVAFGLLLLDEGRIDALFVDPSAFGKGHGRVMLEHLQTQARQHGVRQLRLKASLNAAGFYRACGFTGDQIGTHHSPRGFDLDCVLMEKSIA